MTFDGLPRNHYGAILADPPWRFRTWNNPKPTVTPTGTARSAASHYRTMTEDELHDLPVRELAADDCVLFLWITWPLLFNALSVMDTWGFRFKTCAFAWIKAHARQLEMFQDDIPDQMGLGYWTRANSEPCLLATRG